MRRWIARSWSVLCVVALAGAANAAAPLGGELQVNSYTLGGQAVPSLAVADNGAFVVVWLSGQTGTTSVFGQRFSSAGLKLGGEFQPSSNFTGYQSNSRIAMEGDGEFAVVWHGTGKTGGDTFQGIGVRRFSSAGVALGVEFRANAYTDSVPIEPAVAVDADGDFVVVWDQIQDPSAIGWGIFGRRFTSAGASVGGEFRVTDFTNGLTGKPAIAMEGDGDFVVVWNTPLDGGGGGLGGNLGVMGRRFTSVGARIGAEFLVNSYTWYVQQSPAIAMNDNGSFFVVWTSNNQDGSVTGVFGQRFNADASRVGGEFQVNTFTTSAQYTSSTGLALDAIGMGGDGNFVVVWTGENQDGGSKGVFGQRFTSSGGRVGVEFLINTFTADVQTHPSAGVAATGAFVAVWDSAGYHDGDASGVFGRRFTGFPGGPASDITADGTIDPLTDGLLVLRWLFGFGGGTLTSGAVDPDCLRCDPAGITAYLQSLLPQLDIDDNSAVEPLTDGLLLLRRMFGFSGASLTAGALAQDCQRCDPGAIATYIDGLFQ